MTMRKEKIYAVNGSGEFESDGGRWRPVGRKYEPERYPPWFYPVATLCIALAGVGFFYLVGAVK
jgi:hypothetical protein